MAGYYVSEYGSWAPSEEIESVESQMDAAYRAEEAAEDYAGSDLIEASDLWNAAADAWEDVDASGRQRTECRRNARHCRRKAALCEASAELAILS